MLLRERLPEFDTIAVDVVSPGEQSVFLGGDLVALDSSRHEFAAELDEIIDAKVDHDVLPFGRTDVGARSGKDSEHAIGVRRVGNDRDVRDVKCHLQILAVPRGQTFGVSRPQKDASNSGYRCHVGSVTRPRTLGSVRSTWAWET